MQAHLPNIPSLLLDQLPTEWELGNVPSFRREQLRSWVFDHRAETFDAMTNLPADWRKHLEETFLLRPLSLVRQQGSKDTTRKYLWSLPEGDFIESVLIPASPGKEGQRASRLTLCLSSQVGCAYGCRFCASGIEGWKRHLSPGEIVSQIIEAERISGERITNLVFMGMGEPLANYASLMQAIEVINAPWGLHIGARHITISTSGLAPQIRQLAQEPRQLRLALSLHGASDSVREKIMPINRKWPLAELLAACEYYQSHPGKTMTLEYLLIQEINDSLTEAKQLARHAKRLQAKVNLIPYNHVEGLSWTRPSESVIQQFADQLRQDGAQVTVRQEKGHDIDAACGQLRLKEKAQPASSLTHSCKRA